MIIEEIEKEEICKGAHLLRYSWNQISAVILSISSYLSVLTVNSLRRKRNIGTWQI